MWFRNNKWPIECVYLQLTSVESAPSPDTVKRLLGTITEIHGIIYTDTPGVLKTRYEALLQSMLDAFNE